MRSYRYIQLDANEVRIGDVPELLNDYKMLVDVLKKMVEEHGQVYHEASAASTTI